MRHLPEVKATAAVMDKLLQMVGMTKKKKPVVRSPITKPPAKAPVYRQLELPLR